MAPRTQQTQFIVLGLAAAATVSLMLWYFSASSTSNKKKIIDEDEDFLVNKKKIATSKSVEIKTPPPKSSSSGSSNKSGDDKTPLVKNSGASTKQEEKEIHLKIEELDKKGKLLFKNKQYLEAAQAFTEALDLIESAQDIDTSNALLRQVITLLNNRSAMYEKGSMPELAIEDCVAVLDKDMNHTKARTRKLRILEGLQRWYDALVEICAIQLLFMQANRENLRLGLPVPPPPVPQSKMEEILMEVLPGEMEKYTTKLDTNEGRALPSKYTIVQLLKSYSEYNSWMAQAAKDGPVDKITAILDQEADNAKRAELLLKRGVRYVYDKDYEAASADFEQAYELTQSHSDIQDTMTGYSTLLNWTGMARHWHYRLHAAMECYEKCADLEPTNALILVKQAGVQMDAGKHEEAIKLFDMALGLDPSATDALLHRSNLRMLQGKPEEAKQDLEQCLALRPNHVMARLRLASILAAMSDVTAAKAMLDKAEEMEPNSSEVQSYRGELHFTQGEMEEAREQFLKAMSLEPSNPTPYVNAAMAVLNTPPTQPGQLPDAQGAMTLLQQAIDVDPQFTAAYIQLGQLKLGTATELTTAKQVVALYDEGLKHCRSPEEVKELCSMRILALAQVDAASMLKMETFMNG